MISLPEDTSERVFLLSAVTVLAGALPFSYEFYTLVRIVVFGSLIWFGIQGYGANKKFFYSGYGVLVVLAAILYNPVFQVHLGMRGVWFVLNIGILFLLWSIKEGLNSADSIKSDSEVEYRNHDLGMK